METRIYIAINSDGIERLVEASNQAQVGRHIASDWMIQVADTKTVAKLMNKGVKVENGND